MVGDKCESLAQSLGPELEEQECLAQSLGPELEEQKLEGVWAVLRRIPIIYGKVEMFGQIDDSSPIIGVEVGQTSTKIELDQGGEWEKGNEDSSKAVRQIQIRLIILRRMVHQNNESGHHAELHLHQHLHQQLLQRCGGLEGECLCK